MKDARILVVDDDPLVRDLIVTAISDLGFTNIVDVGSGGAAKALFGRYRPHLTIMDTDLSQKKRGYEFCAEILLAHPDAVIVGISGDPGYKEFWLKAGAKDFYGKPLTLGQIEAVVKKYLSN